MVRVAGSRRQGFTLTEVLVALAIMVILFALLFAPMMAGLDWVSTGRANVNLQNAARFAMEQIRRELGEAVYVYPTQSVLASGAVPNYSQVCFAVPRRDNLGRIEYPVRASVRTTGAGGHYQEITRYHIHLADPTQPYGEDNPFVLYRQELLWDDTQPEGRRAGLFDSSNVWCYTDAALANSQVLTENAMTPKHGATFLPTTSVCANASCGQQTPGYATACPSCGGTEMYYLFNGMQFVPHRVAGEELKTDNGVVYRSTYPAWDGILTGTFMLPPVSISRSELSPRISMYAWNPITQRYDQSRTDMDSWTAATRSIDLQLRPDSGQVQAGQWVTRTLTLTQNGNGWYVPTAAADMNPIWPSYGTASMGTPPAPPTPPPSSPPADSASAPIAFRLDPSLNGTLAPAIIESGSVKVRVIATTGGITREIDLKPSSNYDQASLRGDEFCSVLSRALQDANGNGTFDQGEGMGLTAEVRFSRFDPPRPNSRALFSGGLPAGSVVRLEISYYYRRNYAYDSSRDTAGKEPFVNDVVRMEYSSRTVQNVALTLQGYAELDQTGPTVFVLPPDEHPNEVSLREQVIVRNLGGR